MTRFLTTQHYSSYYLYAEHDARRERHADRCDEDRPAFGARRCCLRSDSGSDSLTVVAGTAALVTSGPAAPEPRASRRKPSGSWIFRTRKNPKVAREFTGVTAMSRDDGGTDFRGKRRWHLDTAAALAEDPEVEKAYAQLRPVRLEHVSAAAASSILLFAHHKANAAHGVNKLLVELIVDLAPQARHMDVDDVIRGACGGPASFQTSRVNISRETTWP